MTIAGPKREFIIRFFVGGEIRIDKWTGTTPQEALELWWHHVNRDPIVEFRTDAGWLRMRSVDILYAEVMSHGR